MRTSPSSLDHHYQTCYQKDPFPLRYHLRHWAALLLFFFFFPPSGLRCLKKSSISDILKNLSSTSVFRESLFSLALYVPSSSPLSFSSSSKSSNKGRSSPSESDMC